MPYADLLLAALALTAGQITRAVTGFGSALVSLPVLAMVWSPTEAVAVCSLLDLLGGLPLITTIRSRVIPSLLIVMFCAQVTGQWFGTALLVALSADQLRLLLGVVLLPLALDILVRPIRKGRGEHASMPVPAGPVYAEGAMAGLVGGLMSGAVGAGGPPIVLFARRWFVPETFRAQVMAAFILGSFPLLSLLAWRGVMTSTTIERSILLLPTVLFGAWFGNRIAPGLQPATFGRVVGVILVFSALTLIGT